MNSQMTAKNTPKSSPKNRGNYGLCSSYLKWQKIISNRVCLNRNLKIDIWIFGVKFFEIFEKIFFFIFFSILGVPCVTTGWGLMDFYDVNSMSSTLQEVAVRVIGNEKCKTYPDYADKLRDTMICAGYKV
mgnify:CR=1 FL=1